MIERDVKNKVRKIIAKFEQSGHVFWTYWPVQTGFGKHGIPDCLVCLKGKLIGIECKVNCKEPTTRQHAELKEIQRAEGFSIIIDEHNLHELEDLFKKILGDESWEAYEIADHNLLYYPAHE